MITNSHIADIAASQLVYERLVERAVQGIFITTMSGNYLFANKALADIYEYSSPDDLIYSINNIADELYVDPNIRNEFKDKINKKGQIWDFEAEIYTKNKAKKWIRESVRAVYNENGNFLYYEGFVSDITHLKKNEKKLVSKKVDESPQDINKPSEVTSNKTLHNIPLIMTMVFIMLFLGSELMLHDSPHSPSDGKYFVKILFHTSLIALIYPMTKMIMSLKKNDAEKTNSVNKHQNAY